MANAKWFFRGVKGDQVGPVSSDTMYSLFAQGTLTAETHVAAAAPTGEPDVWVEAIEVSAFRDRIEARSAKEAKKWETREHELKRLNKAPNFTLEEIGELRTQEKSNDLMRMASKPRFFFPDFGFQCMISPLLVKIAWILTVGIGSLWFLVNTFGFVTAVFQHLAYSPPAQEMDGFSETMRIGFPTWMPILFTGMNILYGIMAVLYVRIMLEIVIVVMRIGKVMGCTEGEPNLSSPSH